MNGLFTITSGIFPNKGKATIPEWDSKSGTQAERGNGKGDNRKLKLFIVTSIITGYCHSL